jgi:CIC family chloride channel protein
MKTLRAWLANLRGRLLAGTERRTPSESALLVLIPVVGVVVGFSSIGIAHLIAILQELLWGRGSDLLAGAMEATWQERVLIPAAGGLLLGLLGLVLRVRMQGRGTPGIIEALALQNGVISLRRNAPGTAGGILTVSVGGSLGREGPMMEFGVAVSSWMGRRLRLEPQDLRILVCAAAAASLSAAYNAPIGASLFALEVLIGSLALPVFGPVVVASIISTLIARNAMGSLPRFVVPEYELVSVYELGGYLVLGLLAGVFSAGVVRVVAWFDKGAGRLRLPRFLAPAIGFALVGGMGVWLPHVYGNGYETVNLALNEQLPIELLILLPFAKLLATVLTRSSGGAGGMFTPTLMMGGLLGGAFGTALHHFFPESTASAGAYTLVGMAAVLAGTTHAPLMAILMIFEQTDSYQIILPLMLVSTISYAVARRIKRESLFVDALGRQGVQLPRGPEEGVMKSLRVRHIMHDDPETVHRADGFQAIVQAFLRHRYNYLYVVDDDQTFVGVIPLHEIKQTMEQADTLATVVVAHDLVETDFEFATPDDTLAATMEKFWSQNSERLPVLDDATSRRLIGWISKRDLIGVYRQEILDEGNLLSRLGPVGDRGRDRYVELPEGFEVASVHVPPAYAGSRLRDLAPRHTWGFYVLQITRRDPERGTRVVEMPEADTVLQPEDELIVVGPVDGVQRFRRSSREG